MLRKCIWQGTGKPARSQDHSGKHAACPLAECLVSGGPAICLYQTKPPADHTPEAESTEQTFQDRILHKMAIPCVFSIKDFRTLK